MLPSYSSVFSSLLFCLLPIWFTLASSSLNYYLPEVFNLNDAVCYVLYLFTWSRILWREIFWVPPRYVCRWNLSTYQVLWNLLFGDCFFHLHDRKSLIFSINGSKNGCNTMRNSTKYIFGFIAGWVLLLILLVTCPVGSFFQHLWFLTSWKGVWARRIVELILNFQLLFASDINNSY